MSDMVRTYQDLIKEAFIDPIRNVTVIDDEYPTLKELLDNSGGSKVAKKNNIDRLKKISEMCHNKHSWSLDVFDGKSPKIGDDNYIPEHLNHSDLLILDYHLDGEATSDNGERARNIIKKLDSNNHFNIILVHTKGANGDIKEVYEEILFDLHEVKQPEFLTVEAGVVDDIESWLDANDDGAGYSWLDRDIAFDKAAILKLLECQNSKLAINIRNPSHIFHSSLREIEAIDRDSGISSDNWVKWRLLEVCKSLSIEFSDISRDNLSWDWGGIESGVNFIATGRVFVSVIRKVSDDPEEELYQAMCDALNKFNASPMHLLMAKIRHEIDERGFEQAQNILSNRPAQAGWLFTLLSQQADTVIHDKAIDLHWEQLGRASKDSLRAFSQKIPGALSSQGDAKSVVKNFFRECISSSDESCGHLNAFTCSMPVVGSHLNTGSILSFNDEYWVCLTPACDLVPGQKAKRWQDRIGEDPLALKAVKLHEISLSTANGKANSNEYIYLNLDDSTELKVFSFFEGDSPTWDTFYALNQGRFADGITLDLAQVREKKGALSINNVKAQVVSELRYEYALNLLQRFGANQTRVGLDFIEKKSLW